MLATMRYTILGITIQTILASGPTSFLVIRSPAALSPPTRNSSTEIPANQNTHGNLTICVTNFVA